MGSIIPVLGSFVTSTLNDSKKTEIEEIGGESKEGDSSKDYSYLLYVLVFFLATGFLFTTLLKIKSN